MTVPLTGLMGIAAVLAGAYYLRKTARRQRQNRPQREVQPPPIATKPPSSFVSGGDLLPIPLMDLRARFNGIKTITISAPGVLLEEWSPEDFEENATIKPDAAEIIKELCTGMHIYLIAHVNHTFEHLLRTSLFSRLRVILVKVWLEQRWIQRRSWVQASDSCRRIDYCFVRS